MNDLQAMASPLRGALFSEGLLEQKEQRLLVLKTGIAGLKHRVDLNSDEGKALLAELVPGTELRLYRDVDNEHDKWAIAVYTMQEQEIGYITRFKNETLARLMDYGKKVTAVVDELPPEPKDETERRRTRCWTENYEVPFSVYLEL